MNDGGGYSTYRLEFLRVVRSEWWVVNLPVVASDQMNPTPHWKEAAETESQMSLSLQHCRRAAFWMKVTTRGPYFYPLEKQHMLLT